MMSPVPALRLSERDNVLTLLAAGRRGDSARTPEGFFCVPLADDVPPYHKIASEFIRKGDSVVKYAVTIGVATENILPGWWVHLGNIRSLVDEKSSGLDIHTGVDTSRSYE